RAVHRIGEHVLTDKWLWAAGLASGVASWFGVSFWIVLPAAGLFYASAAACRLPLATAVAAVGAALAFWMAERNYGSLMAVAGPVQAASVTVPALFLSGLKAGLLTFGGAYTAIPFVRHDAVGRGWVSDGQFLDSLA